MRQAQMTSGEKLSWLDQHSLKETVHKSIWVTPVIGGVKLKMELDTGSDYQSPHTKKNLHM